RPSYHCLILISLFLLVFLIIRLPPTPTLFPYTTLFRSEPERTLDGVVVRGELRIFEEAPERDAVIPAIADRRRERCARHERRRRDRKSTRLNSSHQINSYAVFYLKKNKAD